MEQKVKTKVVATYNGHSVKANKSVELGFKCNYDQLVNYIQLVQFLNVDTTIIAKLPDKQPMKLGIFRVKEVKIEDDGEGQIKFNSMNDFVNVDLINALVGSELIKLMFTAIVELEEEDDEPAEEDEAKKWQQ